MKELIIRNKEGILYVFIVISILFIVTENKQRLDANKNDNHLNKVIVLNN